MLFAFLEVSGSELDVLVRFGLTMHGRKLIKENNHIEHKEHTLENTSYSF
jgi:hypothetical protein